MITVPEHCSKINDPQRDVKAVEESIEARSDPGDREDAEADENA